MAQQTFNDWLRANGWRIVEPDDGPVQYIAPDGTRYHAGQPGFDAALAQIQQQFYSQQMDAQGRPIYGTSGAPDDRSTTWMSPDGSTTYSRTGDPLEEAAGRFQPGYSAQDMFYDPTYGWSINQDALYQQTPAERLAAAMPFIQSLMLLGMPYAQAMGLAFQGTTNALSAFPDVADAARMGLDQFGNMAGAGTDFSGATFGNADGIGGDISNVSYDPYGTGETGAMDMGVGTQDVANQFNFGDAAAGGAMDMGIGTQDVYNQFMTGANPFPPGTPEWDTWKMLQAGGTVAGVGGTIANAAGGGAGDNTGAMDQGTGTQTVRDQFVNGTSGIDPNWGRILPALIGAGAGALGGGDKPAGNTTNTSVTDIPEWLKPYYQALLQETAIATPELGRMTDAERRAIAGITQRATQGSPILNAANQTLTDTLSGQYLDSPIQRYIQAAFANYETPDLQGLRDTASGMYLSPDSNPWLQATYDRAARAVADQYTNVTQPRTDRMFYQGGAFGPGNSAYAETVARNNYGLGENLGNLATDIYGGNYQTERGRQYGAQTALPTFGNQAAGIRLNAANLYSQNYNQERGRQQQGISFAPVLDQQGYQNLFDLYKTGDMQRAPTMNALNFANGILRGTPGSTTTQTQPYYNNQWAGILGGALLGSQFGKSLFGG